VLCYCVLEAVVNSKKEVLSIFIYLKDLVNDIKKPREMLVVIWFRNILIIWKARSVMIFNQERFNFFFCLPALFCRSYGMLHWGYLIRSVGYLGSFVSVLNCISFSCGILVWEILVNFGFYCFLVPCFLVS